MAIYGIGSAEPRIHPTAFVHPDAVIIGEAHIGADASIWPCAVIRADDGAIHIGARSSVQDGSVIHTLSDRNTVVEDDCVIGHMVHLEGCVIRQGALVGNGAIVLPGATVGSGAIVGSNAVVRNGTDVPAGALALGVPAKIREDAADSDLIRLAVAAYVERAALYRSQLRKLG